MNVIFLVTINNKNNNNNLAKNVQKKKNRSITETEVPKTNCGKKTWNLLILI